MDIRGSSTSESGMEMDSDLALHLFEGGAFLILLDVPPKTEFGIDLNSWRTGPKFMGIKMIPPGLHFIYYSPVSKDNQVAPRSGFFHKFSKGEVLVKRWDDKDESLQTLHDASFSHGDNLRNLDPHLGPYPYDSWKKWISLSNRISDATLSRLEPSEGGIIYSVTQLVPEEFVMRSKGGQVQNQEELPDLKTKEGTNIRYTSIPPKYPKGASPADITRNSLDTSFQLESFLVDFNKLYGDQVSSSMTTHNYVNEVLAEVQFSFICFLVGQHYDSFEHWKSLLIMLCSCDDALSKYPELFSSLITDIYFQIKEVPDDFFVDIVSSNNFLVSILTILFSNVRHGGLSIPESVRRKVVKFESYLNKKFDWDFSNEELNEEEMPVVVPCET